MRVFCVICRFVFSVYCTLCVRARARACMCVSEESETDRHGYVYRRERCELFFLVGRSLGWWSRDGARVVFVSVTRNPAHTQSTVGTLQGSMVRDFLKKKKTIRESKYVITTTTKQPVRKVYQ